ncbi:lrr receptor-like serine threonine-protein kinase fls2 [Hordeum vulgare]|nr:lrr receptor-like serine threonine-protein kinase fls2 [Hordeum vulgare]
MGKLLSETPRYSACMEVALGRAWCVMSKLEVKEMGPNMFIFVFQQEGGKRKAVENGPWAFGKELLLIEDFDPAKKLDDYKFEKVPVWVRINNVTLGMMCKGLAKDMGELIGDLMEMDTSGDGTALAQCLRVKVRIRVDEPLMRGICFWMMKGMRMQTPLRKELARRRKMMRTISATSSMSTCQTCITLVGGWDTLTLNAKQN